MFLGVSLKVWVVSFLSVLSLAMVYALAFLPAAIIPTFLLVFVTVLLTILTPMVMIPKGNHTVLKVFIAAMYGFFWPFGLPFIVAIAAWKLFPDDPTDPQ